MCTGFQSKPMGKVVDRVQGTSQTQWGEWWMGCVQGTSLIYTTDVCPLTVKEELLDTMIDLTGCLNI